MVGITKDDGALPSQGLGGASEKSGLLVVLGYIGAQTWLPIVGVVADMYRGGDLALSGLNPLLFSYLAVLGTTACAASFARWRDEWSRGVFGAFCGRVGCHRRRSASARSRTGRLCGSCGSTRRVRRAARLGRRFAHHGMERTLWTAGCSGALPGFVSRRTRCLPAGGLRSVHRHPLVAACSGRRVLGGVQRLVHGVGVSR